MEKYHIAEWNEDSEWSEDYSMLKGPNGFECCLTEPEDRVWYRDGQGVIGELNRLYAELNKPITEHPDVQRLIGQVVELQKNLEVWREACGNNEKKIEELEAELKAKDKVLRELLAYAEEGLLIDEHLAAHIEQALKGE